MSGKRLLYYLGSRPLEESESYQQWFLVGEAGDGIVGGKFAAFQSEAEAIEYIRLKSKAIKWQDVNISANSG